MQLLIAATLPALVVSARLRNDKKSETLQGMTVQSVPMYMYKRDCWKKRHWSFSQQDKIPGAGMNIKDLEPFQEVLKDGFYQVDCIKDYMLEFGDKHGKNKFQYNQGEISNVSVVRYSDVVPKTDQEPMSHAVCFAFCRGVQDMLFFGIKNGKDCYCSPYYKDMASDSSQCDATCPGQQTLMCGGKSKSSIFSMHSCARTGKDLSEAKEKAASMVTALDDLSGKVKDAGDEFQAEGEKFQKMFSEVGDFAGSQLMQSAKVFAGELLAAAGEAGKVKDALTELETSAGGMAGGDFSTADATTKAEGVVAETEEEVAKAELKSEELTGMLKTALPNGTLEDKKLYYPVMYFVNKSFENMSTTCEGDALNTPMLGSYDSCAAACDEQSGKCVGFSYTVTDSTNEGLCFMFSKLKAASYYTGCDEDKPSTMCDVKFSEYSGLSLAPDASGKCKHCLKKAEERGKCYKK
jgi:hypothetical protein